MVTAAMTGSRRSVPVKASIERLRHQLDAVDNAAVDVSDDEGLLDTIRMLERAIGDAGKVVGAERRAALLRISSTRKLT